MLFSSLIISDRLRVCFSGSTLRDNRVFHPRDRSGLRGGWGNTFCLHSYLHFTSRRTPTRRGFCAWSTRIRAGHASPCRWCAGHSCKKVNKQLTNFVSKQPSVNTPHNFEAHHLEGVEHQPGWKTELDPLCLVIMKLQIKTNNWPMLFVSKVFVYITSGWSWTFSARIRTSLWLRPWTVHQYLMAFSRTNT